MVVAESPRAVCAAEGATPRKELSVLFQSTLPLRFWQKIYADPSDCWLWMGYIDQHGYGRLGPEMKNGTRLQWFFDKVADARI